MAIRVILETGFIQLASLEPIQTVPNRSFLWLSLALLSDSMKDIAVVKYTIDFDESDNWLSDDL